MQEFIGLAYFAEIPAVIFDVQRGGPSTGMPTRTQQADLLACAYASHGDTKHVLLFPEDPTECFEFAAQAFDLADRLQTPIFVMLDLDIGMKDWLCEPFAVGRHAAPRSRQGHDRRGCSTRARDFGRYLDVDGDGIPYRTIRARMRPRGSYFTRGTTKDRYARYSETGPDYVDNMQRLLRKFETAKKLVPAPLLYAGRRSPRASASIFFGSTSPAMDEALDVLAAQRHPPRRAARARVSRSTTRSTISSPRTMGVRRRAEPRRAAEDAAGQRAQDRSVAAAVGAALRRHADHRALHRRRRFRSKPLRARSSLRSRRAACAQ